MTTRRLRTQSNRQLKDKKIKCKINSIKAEKNATNAIKINLKGEQFKQPRKEKFQANNSNSNDNDKKKDNDLMDFLRVSVEDNESDDYVPLHKREYQSESQRYSTYLFKYLELVFKYGLMVVLMCTNFIALSLSLNCNAGEEFFKRIASAIFAFFFGFIYILVNYYTYRVMSKGQICKMNKEKLFPFNA